MSGLHTNSDPTARIKGGCSVAAALLLMACSTVSQPVIPPAQQSSTAVIDAPVKGTISRIETINTDIVSNENLTPSSAVLKSSEEAPIANDSELPKLKSEFPPKIAKTSQPKKTTVSAGQTLTLPEPVIVDRILRTGNLENSQLTELSGMSASKDSPGVLYAINDGGNSATLYALSEKGQHISQWAIRAQNRDWEDLDSIEISNQNYILIGDTGDNLRIHSKSTFYLVAEPVLAQRTNELLTPYMTLDFTYEDGPRNVEAFAAHGTTIYLISKEPVSPSGTTASRLYALQIPLTQPAKPLTATFVTELPIPRPSLQSKLAASFAGIDLDHVTAMDITASGRTAYLLTYREVHKIERSSDQSWSAAFQSRGKRIHTHKLGQAEALTIAPGRSVFITSEKRGAPLWSIPIQAAP